MYFVYILFSDQDKRTYVGYTKNLEARLRLHNLGRVEATRHRRPLRLLLVKKFNDQREAKEQELWWKSSSGRNKMKELFK